MLNILDSDECADSTDNCHDNAFCENTLGSYQCECLQGYQGDGIFCKGELRNHQQ